MMFLPGCFVEHLLVMDNQACHQSRVMSNLNLGATHVVLKFVAKHNRVTLISMDIT